MGRIFDNGATRARARAWGLLLLFGAAWAGLGFGFPSASLVAPERPAAMAEAIQAVLRSEDLADALTAAGRRNAAAYTIERTAAAYAALYRALAGSGRGGRR